MVCGSGACFLVGRWATQVPFLYGAVCSGEEGVSGKGESEGRLQPDDTEDEGVSGRHKTAEGWSPPDCCGEGKGWWGEGGETATGHSLSAGE